MYFGLLSILTQVGVTFSNFAHMGAPFPHLTLGDFGPRDTDKNGFCSGAIDPHLGFGCQAPQNNFFYFTENPQNEFSLKFVSRQLYASTSIPEILKKIYRAVFEKMGFKILGAWHFFEFAHLGGSLPPPDPWRFWP